MRKKIITAGLGSVLVGGAALYFLILGLISTFNSIDLITQGVATTGTVVSVQADNESSFPTISFKTSDGQTVQFSSNINNQYQVKEQVPIIYNRANPHRANINNFGTLWVASTFQFIIALLLVIASLVPIRACLKYRWWFKHQRVMASISEVKTETDPAMTSYRVVSNWSDPSTGRTYVFQSDELDFDPRQRNDTTVAVDIDPKNPEHYYIDKDWLRHAQDSQLEPVPSK